MSSSTELIITQPTANNNTYHKIESRIITNLKALDSKFKSGQKLLKYMVLLTNAIRLPKNASATTIKELAIESGSGSQKLLVRVSSDGEDKTYFVKKYIEHGNEVFFKNFNKTNINMNNGELYKIECIGDECCFTNNRVLQELIVNFVMKNINILYPDAHYSYDNIHTYEFINMARARDGSQELSIYQKPIGFMLNGGMRTTMEDILSVIIHHKDKFTTPKGYKSIDKFLLTLYEPFITSYKKLVDILDYKHGDMHTGNVFIKTKLKDFIFNSEVLEPRDVDVLSEQIILLHSDFDLARINVGKSSFMPIFTTTIKKTINVANLIQPLGKFVRTTCKFKSINSVKTKKSNLTQSMSNSNNVNNKNVTKYIYEMFDILCMYISILLFAKNMDIPYTELKTVNKLFDEHLRVSYMKFKPKEITELLINSMTAPSIRKTFSGKSKIIPLTVTIEVFQKQLLKYNTVPYTNYM